MSAAGSDAATAGAGSVWNPNSWHWENRNYSKWGDAQLKERLLGFLHADPATGLFVRCKEVKECKTEAAVNIRKGKKIPTFDIHLVAVMEAVKPNLATASAAAEAAATASAKGEEAMAEAAAKAVSSGEVFGVAEFKVHELMPDDVDDDFEVRSFMTSIINTADNAIKAKDVLKANNGPVAKAIRPIIRQWHKDLLVHDGGQEKLAMDAKLRAEEAAKTAAAKETTDAEKQRIAALQAEREAKRKEEEIERAKKLEELAAIDAKAKAAAEEQRRKAAIKEGIAEGEGSVWNKGNYHWEEKPLTAWAKERLSALVKGFNIDLPGGHCKIVNVELTGEASASIRKGKKLLFFDFKVKALWEGQLVDTEGKVLGTGDGEILIPELDQDNAGGISSPDEPGDYEVKVTAAEDGGKNDKELQALLQKHGMKDFRGKIAAFVKELRDRG
jgi:Activator of Hsp90 ATPase, N-terminal